MFPLSPRVLTYFLIVVGGTCLVSGVFFVYMILSKLGIIWTPFSCLTDELGLRSSNANPQAPYGLDPLTLHYIKRGYEIGQTGVFDRPATR